MTYLSRPLRAREAAHRRRVLLWMGALIVLGTSPVIGHHLASSASTFLAGRDHLFGLCLIALHFLLAPIHRVFHLLLVAGLVYAVWDRGRAGMSLRRTVRYLERGAPPIDGALARAALMAGVAPDRVLMVHGLPNPAFTAGWFAPRVYVDAALGELLSEQELAAVLAHEGAHVARRDPLRLSLFRLLARTLFYLPALRRLADDAEDEAEIAADDAAARRIPDRGPLVLASAIVQIAGRWGSAASVTKGPLVGLEGAAVGFERVDLLDRRVRRLMGQDARVGTHVTRRSLAGAAAVLTAVWMSGLIMAHPLPAGVDDGFFGLAGSPAHAGAPGQSAHQGMHCDHHGSFALMHLFCLGFGARAPGAPCPHATVVGTIPGAAVLFYAG